jgi:hypothetical protein
MKDFLNSNAGLLFALTLIICAAGVENKMIEEFDSQVGDKAADFFKQTFGQEPEQQTEEQEAADESPITE